MSRDYNSNWIWLRRYMCQAHLDITQPNSKRIALKVSARSPKSADTFNLIKTMDFRRCQQNVYPTHDNQIRSNLIIYPYLSNSVGIPQLINVYVSGCTFCWRLSFYWKQSTLKVSAIHVGFADTFPTFRSQFKLPPGIRFQGAISNSKSESNECTFGRIPDLNLIGDSILNKAESQNLPQL